MDYLSYFSVKDGSLFFYNKNLHDLAKKYGTPAIIYSKQKILENVRKLKGAFGIDSFSIHFAIKANFNPKILAILRDLGVGADVATLNEALLALQLGFKPEKIIASPNNLSEIELTRLSKLGIVVNFDDIGQIELIKENTPEVVSFRVNPGIGKGEFKETTTGGKDSKFGMPPEVASRAYKLAKDLGVKRFGIHMMTGSNVLDPIFFKNSSRIFFDIAEEISRENRIDFEFLDLGGGLGVPYRANEDELDVDSVGKYVLENFNQSRSRGYFKNSTLVLEPGRFITANTAVLLSSVTNIKNYDGLFVGLDVSINSLMRIPLYGAEHPILFANRANEEPIHKGNLVGQICENTDILAKDIRLPGLRIGDVLVVVNAGAYVSSMSSNYNLLRRPTEIMIDGNEEKVIRREETLEDMTAIFR